MNAMHSHDTASENQAPEQQERTYHVTEALVVVLDVLGQSQLLRAMRAFPRSPDEMARVRDLLPKTAGLIEGLRKAFADNFQSFSQPSYFYSKLTEAQQAEYRRIRVNRAIMHGFSDMIVITVPLLDDNDHFTDMFGVFGAMAACAIVQFACLASGHCLRGGMEKSWVVPLGETEFYGPGLEESHALEQKADTPRIIAGDRFARYLSEMASMKSTSKYSESVRNFSKFAARFFYIDSGQQVLDFAGEAMREVAGSDPQMFALMQGLIGQSRIQVDRSLEQWRGLGNERIAGKYKWLADYLGSRMSLWQ